MGENGDFLEELVTERQARNPAFSTMVKAAQERRRMLRQLAEERTKRGFTQTQVAAAMGTSQSSVARIEAGRADVRLSSVERYAATLGRRVQWRLSPAKKGSGRSSNHRGRAKTRR